MQFPLHYVTSVKETAAPTAIELLSLAQWWTLSVACGFTVHARVLLWGKGCHLPSVNLLPNDLSHIKSAGNFDLSTFICP